MTEADQKRVQTAVEEMVQSLEKDNIRKIQGRMFRCGADCCDRSTHTMSQVHQCVERCHAPLAQAQQLVTTELERFQERLIRCTMHCSDKAKDLHDSGANETAVQALLDRCASSCAEDHVKLIPGLTRRLKENLDSLPH